MGEQGHGQPRDEAVEPAKTDSRAESRFGSDPSLSPDDPTLKIRKSDAVSDGMQSGWEAGLRVDIADELTATPQGWVVVITGRFR